MNALAWMAVAAGAAGIGYLLGKTGRPECRRTGIPGDRNAGGPEYRRTGIPRDRETGRPPLVRLGPGGDFTRDYRPGERLDLTA